MEYDKPELKDFDEEEAFGAACNKGAADNCATGGDADSWCTSGTGAHAHCDSTGSNVE